MVRRGPGAHKHKSDEQSAAATNYQRKENCQNGATSVGFMSARQPDAVAHKRPNAGYQSATERYDLQRASGALRKSHHTKSSFKRLVSAANDHQAEMHDPTADKKANHDEQRQQDDHCNRADSHPGHCGKTIILIRKQADGLETEREQKRHNPTHASADERVDERLAQAAFALHHTECFGWTSKHD